MSLLRRLLGQFVSFRAILLILACGQTKLDVSIARVKIRVLVVDDEPLARERLRKLLEKEPEIELIGECADGASAVETIHGQSPDLVFLDVQMPELDGFGVLSQLERGKMPAVVFTTAHDQFALKAFEIHAVDYLLKPFGKERFQTALHRAIDQVRRHHAGDLSQRLSALLADVQSEPKSKYAARIAVKSSGRVVFVKVDDLDWVEAADNYVSLHVGNEEHLHRETMAALEAQLPPAKFMRISRSTIVNVDRIKELQPLFHGEYAVILRNGAKLTLSRSYRDKLDALMGRMS
jgi:two-component system LytT family response regulator